MTTHAPQHFRQPDSHPLHSVSSPAASSQAWRALYGKWELQQREITVLAAHFPCYCFLLRRECRSIDVEILTHDDSPLKQLGFLAELASDRKQTKDGLPPKRRGPKPDSKPALTRRQELNRQAQRTHRERKETYIKALEQEVLRLKELYTKSSQQRDLIAEENHRLKALLAAHGISYDFGNSPVQFKLEHDNHQLPSSSGSISGSYRPASDSVSHSSPTALSGQQALSPQSNQSSSYASMAQLPSNRVDYDQIGIDFVLTLERPCMEHMQYLLVRSHNSDNQFFHHPMENPKDDEQDHMAGHALMATAPPHSHIMETPAEAYPHRMPELSKPDLARLLDLSNRLPIDREGEITPIMAWTLIIKHNKVAELDEAAFESLRTMLAPKVTCYGFGAVIEEFEVRDALHAVLQQKSGSAVRLPLFAPDQVPRYV